jgi:bifunctional non-homologous end joining protein LigD
LDWTKRFSLIAGALDISGQAISTGRWWSSTMAEQTSRSYRLNAAGNQDRLTFYAFDLLLRDGDLRRLPQIERKQALVDLLGENGIEALIVYSEHLSGDAHEMFEHAAKLNFEGIVSKNAQNPTAPIATRAG